MVPLTKGPGRPAQIDAMVWWGVMYFYSVFFGRRVFAELLLARLELFLTHVLL
jgi:hypothetical protein